MFISLCHKGANSSMTFQIGLFCHGV